MNKSEGRYEKPGATEQGAAEDAEWSAELIEQIVKGAFAFRARLPVSEKSFFGDDLWDWYDQSNERLNIYVPCQLRIDWKALRLTHSLTGEIIDDLKRYAFLRYSCSGFVFPTSKKRAHPYTLSEEINTLAAFISHICNRMSGEGFALINKLSDITVQDLRDGLATYPRKCHVRIRTTLRCLGSAAFATFLKHGPLQWTTADADTLKWNIKPKQHYEKLPDGMFRLLSNSATADVKQFLRALGLDTRDTTPIGDDENLYLSELDKFKELYETYFDLHDHSRTLRYRDGRRIYDKRRRALKGVRVRLHELINRARSAAQTIITGYLGARVSELSLLKRGCLTREGDQWIILGTVVKGKEATAPINEDRWVTIPIVCDAVKVLEETGRLIGSDYLFHGVSVLVGKRPMVSAGLNDRLTAYLKLADRERRWATQRITVHQFRNSLTFELRKAGLGLPLITLQLKHKYFLDRRVNNVTLTYGSLGSDAAMKAAADANEAVLRDIYHPDSPVAGGGAEQHKQRRTDYFRGMALRGVSEDEVFKYLATQGMPLADVGAAYCQGQGVVVIDGIKAEPPCLGGLRCNPVRCPHGIITEGKASAWERAARENRSRAQDPAFAYARTTLEEAADEADAVVSFLRAQRARKEAAGLNA